MSLRNASLSVGVVAALATLTFAAPALAGPPLLCHPFDIGTARSLPWDGVGNWARGQADYKLAHLISDTEALLAPSTPVIVRMETLRRAAIYASHDRDVATRLLARLTDRARASENAGRPDALALLDAGYLTEALRQISYLTESAQFKASGTWIRGLIGGTDGYAMVKKAIVVRPDDPAMEFAAALIAADKNRPAYQAHATRARAGVNRDKLLALNIGHVS